MTADLITENIIGESALIKRVKQLIAINCQYDAPVLISGETGTGKELAARGIHYGSSRSSQPFVAINCSTFTDELFTSELFGYVKGAFTDAKENRLGLLAAAEGGTIFLDELDSLSLKSQVALLRVLQEKEYRPIGARISTKTSVRIIAATNQDLVKLVSEQRFREDLYYRLFVLTIEMPPLRKRIEDIPILAETFLKRLQKQYNLGEKHLDEKQLAEMKAYPWPGNVRELENGLHRFYLIDQGMPQLNNEAYESTPIVSSAHYPQDTKAMSAVDGGAVSNALALESHCFNFGKDKQKAIEDFESAYVKRLLDYSHGNVSKAARLCGKERRAFGKLVKKYHLKSLGYSLTSED